MPRSNFLREEGSATRSTGTRLDLSKLEISDFLTYRLNILYRLLDRQLKQTLADRFAFSVADWRVLGQLATNPPITLRHIAASTYMAKSQISRAAASLVNRGYAIRKNDVSDARSALFAITKHGRKKYETILSIRRENQRRLLEQLSPTQRRHIFEAISRLTAYLDNDVSSPSR